MPIPGPVLSAPAALERGYRRLAGVWSMASNRSDPESMYPRLHVEMRRLSKTVVLIDGWLIENAKGRGRTVLRYCGSKKEAREQISNCVSKYSAHCDDEDIVMLCTETPAARTEVTDQSLVRALG